MKHTLSLAALVLVALAGTGLAAQNVAPIGGAATGASVTLLGVTNTAGRALLPDTGGMTSTDVDALQIPGQVAADALTSMTSGSQDQKKSGAQSVTQLENVNILNGLIQAGTLIAVASSSLSSAGATSNAFGSSLTNLVVNGVPIGSGDLTPAPNTRINLPGTGYVILNEQTVTGDGVSTSGIVVNLIHVVLQNPLTHLTTGEIMVGSVRSQVGS
ncbi:MAG TPA: choice-of-anchor P family protein [Gemmatimonadales bacterium]|nr:choice-of-anchor P family protein [Gemmatimonadales bacterium]